MKRVSLDAYVEIARFTGRMLSIAEKAVVGAPQPAVQKGFGGYAYWLIVAIHGLRDYLDHPHRRLMDMLSEMHRICRILHPESGDLPDFSTVSTRIQDIKMTVWRGLLERPAKLHETGEIQAIDATGMDRIAASKHYAKRTNYTFRAVKTTAFIDCKTGAILDIHWSMKQLHDSQVGWQLLKRNRNKLTKVTADKGYRLGATSSKTSL